MLRTSVDLLQNLRAPKPDDGDHRNDQEDQDRNCRGETVVRTLAAEGEAVGVADQQVGRTRRRIVRREWTTARRQIDRIKIVEIEGKRSDQQWPGSDKQQGEGNRAEGVGGLRA